MLSFNQELKDEIVTEIIRHREQEQIIQGTYGDESDGEWKGCAVGCAIHSLNLKKGKNFSFSDHRVYETEFGIPVILARLEDRIFEGLSVEDSKTWPEKFMSAVPVNADLSLIWPKFAVWLLTDKNDGVINYSSNKEVAQKISDLYLRLVNGGEVSFDEWIDAKNDASSSSYADAAADAAYAAADAAYDAAYADYASSSYASSSYADYAADADDYAAYAAADAAYAAAHAAADAAVNCHYKKMADKLIEILQNTK